MRRSWILIATAAATLLVVGYPLNGNLRYETGVHRVSGCSAADTFSHRPMLFRLISAGQAWLPTQASGLFGEPGSFERAWAFEAGYRLLGFIACAVAAALLARGLRRWLGSASWAYGLAAYAALVFTAPATGEPDWWAAVLAVAAVGAAGLFERPWAGGAASGVLLAGVALVKLSTLPVGLAALVIVVALDRRRGVLAGASAFVAGSVAIVLIAVLVPHELAWLLDIRALQPPLWTADTPAELFGYLANLAARWPTIVLLPAFFVGAPLREAVPAAAAIALAAAGFVAQGQYFGYHAIPLVVLSAALAVTTLRRSHGLLRWPLLAWIGWTAALFVLPAEWRLAHQGVLFRVAGGGALLLALGQAVAIGRRPRLTRAATTRWAALLALLAMLATQSPWSAESLSLGTASKTSAANLAALRSDLADAARIHAVIGDEPVAYLTFGATTYLLGNPTRCRYPSPLFLQRPRAAEKVSAATRGENLGCLTQPDARWLVWDRDWLHRKGAPADLLAVIDATWNCADAVVVDGLTLCPRREGPR